MLVQSSIAFFLFLTATFKRIVSAASLCMPRIMQPRNTSPLPLLTSTPFSVYYYGVSNYCLTFVCTFQILYKRLVTVFDQIAWRRFLIDMTWRVVLQFSRLFGQPPPLSICFTTQNSNGSDHLSAKRNHKYSLLCEKNLLGYYCKKKDNSGNGITCKCTQKHEVVLLSEN